ncbi:chemotaxis protein CheX [Dactylosporangium sp. NBC_01737]|nr:chemotaxis protein CheX [Dactylosporangium sp. NBC_01737]
MVMMDLAPGAASCDDIKDTAGEFMNVVFGTSKSLLPQPGFVSLPQW